MSPKKIDNRLKTIEDESADGSGASTSGGQGGKIEFRDFLATGVHLRDDILPYEEQKRLLSNHSDIHELKVKQQKEKRDQYKALKNGEIKLAAHRAQRMNAGMGSQYKQNPILANKAQFSGIDQQVNMLPTENLAETNQDKRDELRNELQFRYQPQYQPSFNPKPRGPGS